MSGPDFARSRAPLARVALATSADWRDLAPDDRAIVPALARLGVISEIAVWTDDSIDWRRFDLIVVRSCWDYHEDLPRWLAWVDAVGTACGSRRLCNAPSLLRWNARKTYLFELAARGVPVVPTRLLDAADLASEAAFKAALASIGWDDVVLKPAVSAGAFATLRFRPGTAALGPVLATFASPEVAARGPILAQPYLPEIAADGATGGEWSLLYFDGAFSHAVCKRPAAGDFRVQERHGGSTIAAAPPPSCARVAAQTLAAAAAAAQATQQTFEAQPLYARVDLVVSGGSPLVMELEVIEPALFLAQEAAAVDRLASAIAARL